MRKEQRLKKNEEFTHVFKRGSSVANRQFVLYSLAKEGQTQFRIGLSVSKRIGNAVTRNRIKRLIRAFFQQNCEKLRQDVDYVIIARKPTSTMNYHEVENSLNHVFKKGRLKKKKV